MPHTGADAKLGDFKAVKQNIHNHEVQISGYISSSSSFLVRQGRLNVPLSCH